MVLSYKKEQFVKIKQIHSFISCRLRIFKQQKITKSRLHGEVIGVLVDLWIFWMCAQLTAWCLLNRMLEIIVARVTILFDWFNNDFLWRYVRMISVVVQIVQIIEFVWSAGISSSRNVERNSNRCQCFWSLTWRNWRYRWCGLWIVQYWAIDSMILNRNQTWRWGWWARNSTIRCRCYWPAYRAIGSVVILNRNQTWRWGWCWWTWNATVRCWSYWSVLIFVRIFNATNDCLLKCIVLIGQVLWIVIQILSQMQNAA